jgi:hypothetical protein
MSQTKPLNKASTITLLLVIAAFILATNGGCNHYDELQRSARESSLNEDSHNSGEDCNKCHHEEYNGASSNWWYIAGTTFDANGQPTSDAEIQLWTDSMGQGTLIYTLKPDQSGNFYTDKVINFKGGYYPFIKYGNKSKGMKEKVVYDDLNKSCNKCHGNGGGISVTSQITLN